MANPHPDLARMLELREQGMSYQKIGDRIGVSKTVVYDNIRHHEPPGEVRNRYDHDEIRKLARDGWTRRKIAAHLHCSPGAVAYALHQSGAVAMGTRSRQRRAEVVRRLAEGQTAQQIATAMGLSYGRVLAYWRAARTQGDAGVPPSQRSTPERAAELRREVIERTLAGQSVKRIADEVGLAQNTVRSYRTAARRQGIELPDPRRHSPDMVADVARRLAKGDTAQQVSAEVGVPVRTVYSIRDSAAADDIG